MRKIQKTKILAATLALLAWSTVAFCGEIHDAIQKGDLETVKALIKENPAILNSKDTKKLYAGMTPLHLAAAKAMQEIQDFATERRREKVFIEIAEFLLASGADVNAKDDEGKTPLHRVAFKEMADILLAKGADVKAKDNDGKTPLHVIAKWIRVNIAESLLAKGANVNARDNSGGTPLHEAASSSANGFVNMAKLLIEKGADIGAKTKDGQTPLQLSEKTNHKDIAELLRKHGAKE